MAVKTKEELLESLKNKFGDDNGDDVLSIIEDITDTYDNFANNDNTNWKDKYEQNDKEWRQKYRDRFYNTESKDDEQEDERPKILTYDELFKEG